MFPCFCQMFPRLASRFIQEARGGPNPRVRNERVHPWSRIARHLHHVWCFSRCDGAAGGGALPRFATERIFLKHGRWKGRARPPAEPRIAFRSSSPLRPRFGLGEKGGLCGLPLLLPSGHPGPPEENAPQRTTRGASRGMRPMGRIKISTEASLKIEVAS